MRKNTKEDFYRNVYPEPNTGCWLWGGKQDDSGYGSFYLNGIARAHRVSLYIHCVDFNVNLDVLHRCDNPSCVNPEHLYQGTQSDNNRDRFVRGRTCRGGDHPKSKLSVDDVKNIRSNKTLGIREMGRMYNVSHTLIRRVISRESWNHV